MTPLTITRNESAVCQVRVSVARKKAVTESKKENESALAGRSDEPLRLLFFACIIYYGSFRVAPRVVLAFPLIVTGLRVLRPKQFSLKEILTTLYLEKWVLEKNCSLTILSNKRESLTNILQKDPQSSYHPQGV